MAICQHPRMSPDAPAQRREWKPHDGPLLVVSAHPDDEVAGVGGLIHTWAGMGRHVTILSVTDGEADQPADENRALVRRDELKAALRKLCATHVPVVRLGLPDGGVAQYRNRVRNAVESLLEPRTTLIAPYEGDHTDDEVIGQVCREVARAHGAELARYPTRAWLMTHAPGGDGRWAEFALDMEAQRAKAHALECFITQERTHQRPTAVGYESFVL
jgi:LmbE family N-acetylglucosaminyl deacetylase